MARSALSCLSRGALALALLASPAAAHEPYTSLKHPRTGLLCCNGADCAPIAAERVEHVPGGYRVDRRHFVPGSDVIPSWDGEHHACFWPGPDDLRCLVVPLAM